MPMGVSWGWVAGWGMALRAATWVAWMRKRVNIEMQIAWATRTPLARAADTAAMSMMDCDKRILQGEALGLG